MTSVLIKRGNLDTDRHIQREDDISERTKEQRWCHPWMEPLTPSNPHKTRRHKVTPKE